MAFSLPSMPIGSYTVSADLTGFQRQAAENVRVSIGKVTTVDFTMPEAFSEEITVIGRAADHRCCESDLRHQVRFGTDHRLPTRGNFYDLIAVTPGMVQMNEGSSRVVGLRRRRQVEPVEHRRSRSNRSRGW